MSKKIKFFKTPQAFRMWLHENHKIKTELIVGFYKVATKKPSITWSQSVDQAICYGWIDGIRRRVDDEAYTIRFTPRKSTSIWSAVNIKKVEELTKERLMMPAGTAAYSQRQASKSKIYAYEKDEIKLDKAYETKIRANKKAWSFFDNLAPSYKKNSIYHVMSAKQEATRLRRLNILIESSEQGLKIPSLRKPGEK